MSVLLSVLCPNHQGKLVIFELCILGDAGRTVSKDVTSKHSALKEAIVKEFYWCNRLLDKTLFQTRELHKDMYKRLFGARNKSYVQRICGSYGYRWRQRQRRYSIICPTAITPWMQEFNYTMYIVYENVISDHYNIDFVSELYYVHCSTLYLIFFRSIYKVTARQMCGSIWWQN